MLIIAEDAVAREVYAELFAMRGYGVVTATKNELRGEFKTTDTFTPHSKASSLAKFVVESNSVSLAKQPAHFPNGGTTTQLIFGADIYIVYKPGPSRNDLAINSDLQFIQVAYTTRAVHPTSFRHEPDQQYPPAV